MLFQTGYLTIADERHDDGFPQYRLSYPNREVRRALNASLLDALAPQWRRPAQGSAALRRLLAACDWAALESLLRVLLAGNPHDWHRRNEIANYEGYWASVFYAFFQASLDGVSVEDATSRGRLDLAEQMGRHVYLFEFKMAQRAGRGGAGADEGAALRRQVPRAGSPGPPDRDRDRRRIT